VKLVNLVGFIIKKLTTDRHPCPRRHFNQQSERTSGRRPTP